MLTEMELKDFKSFAEEKVVFAPLTLLVGANASGKSNLLDALRFLQGAGQGIALEDVLRGRWEAGREVWPGIRGGIPGVVRRESDTFTLATQWTINEHCFKHRISVAVAPDVRVAAENLEEIIAGNNFGLLQTGSVSPEASSAVPPGTLPFALRHERRNTWVHGGLGSVFQSTLGQVRPVPRADPSVSEYCNSIRNQLQRMLFLNIMPGRMRGYVPRQTTQLGSEGENISALVWRLCQDKEQKQDLIEWISELCAPEIRDIDFVETDLGDVMLLLVEKDGTRIPARNASDGTLRFLGELVALRTAPEGSVVLIEEIENGLHPTRVHLLVELLESITGARGIQVIATTHSPITLLSLSGSSLENSVVFARHPDRTGTVTSRLKDLPHFGEILEKRDIDHLFTSGWLERAL